MPIVDGPATIYALKHVDPGVWIQDEAAVGGVVVLDVDGRGLRSLRVRP